MSRNSWLVVLACTLLLCSLPMLAATQNAVVYGTVYDASGNPMAGVTVTLENPAFGFSRTTTSGSDGSYNFAEVPPAEGYKVTATLNGRTVDVRGGIAVNVGDERVILPPLKEQAVAPTPTPGTKPQPAPTPSAAEGPSVHPETVSSSISGVVTRDQLLALPLYNRNFLALGLITPEVHDVQQGSNLAGASFSVIGNRPETNNFLLDGSDNVATSSNQAIPFQVNDSIQEFRVVSSNATAEYGRGQGGVINVVTRRATNQWHGSAYGYFGDQGLNSDSALSVYNGTTFHQAAAYAGPVGAAALVTPDPTTLLPASPVNYNQYVATAEATGFCTNSIGLPGGVACPATGGTGLNTRFDPAAILATNNSHTIPFSSQQFGFNLGGPIRKDKIFVFGSYEGTRINNPNPIFERVPSTFDRTFGALNARTGGGFPAPTFASGLGATDPSFLMAQSLLALYPTPNVIGVPDALEFFRGEAPNYTHVHNILGRADWVQSDKSTWSFRYVGQLLNQLHDDTLPQGGTYPGNGSFRDAFNHNLNVSFSHTFSPTLLNEFHAGFNRFDIDETPQDKNFFASTLGFPGDGLPSIFLSGLDTQYSGNCSGCAFGSAFGGWFDTFWTPFIFGGVTVQPMMPTLDGLFPMARLGAPLNSPAETKDTTGFFGDTLSWTHGKHSFKFGGDFRHINDHYFDGSFSRGFVVSSNIGEFTNDSETCQFLCSLLGRAAFSNPSFDYATRQSAPYVSTFDHVGIAGFFQDTWRVSRRVTINLGLRYEYFSTPTEENNRIWNFDPVAHGLVQQNSFAVSDPMGNTCPGPGFGFFNIAAPADALTSFTYPWNCGFNGNGAISRKNATNFAPRLGLAWDIFGTGRTVFRGGVGWFYDQLPTNQYADLMYNRPTSFNAANPQLIYGQAFLSTLFGGTCNANTTPIPGISCGMGNITVNPANPAFSPVDQSAVSPFGMMAMDFQNSDTPHTMQANASIQQQLGNHMVLEVGYVGGEGSHLPVVHDANFNDEWFCTTTVVPFPCDINSFYPVMQMSNVGSSSYNSLLVRVREQQWHGLSFNATYVWSKSTDNASAGIFPLLPVTMANASRQIQLSGLGSPTSLCYGLDPVSALGLTSFFGPLPATLVCPPVAPNVVSAGSALTTTGQGLPIVSRYLIPQDPNNFLHNDWGPSDFNVPHRFVLDYAWQVPGSGMWRGNWMLSGVFIAQSGQPFTIFSGPIYGQIDQRVNVRGAVTQNNGNPNDAISFTNLQVASRPCFVATGNPIASSGTLFSGTAGTPCIGDSGRNQFTGPNYINLNMAIQKGFQVFGEGRMLTFRAELYNLTNRANFFNPISQMSLDGIGAAFASGSSVSNINPQFGKIQSVHDPREIQFAVRFTF